MMLRIVCNVMVVIKSTFTKLCFVRFLYLVRFLTFFVNNILKNAILLKLENCSTSMVKVLTISLSWIHHLVLANKVLHNWRKRLLLLLMVMYVVWINVMIKVFFEKQAYKMIYYLNKKISLIVLSHSLTCI